MNFERSGILIALSLVWVTLPQLVSATEISNVIIKEITPDTATIEWMTDVPSDATINYGLDENVGLVRYPEFDKKEHSLVIDKLEPSTTYHFRVVSTDEGGNKSATAGFVFTTKALNTSQSTAKIVDQKERAVTERILEDLETITDPNAIIAISNKVKKVAGEILKPPTILGETRLVISSTEVEISWTTDRESSSMVFLATDAEYNPAATNPYSMAQGDPVERVKKHAVRVVGLEPATVYHFKVSSEDDAGLKGETNDDTFKTKSLLPEIRDLKVSRVQETAATISWATPGVLAKGLVEYTNLRTGATKSLGNPVYAETQSITLTGLEFGTRYSAVARSTNESGDEFASDPFTFITVRDIVAPEISKVNNESTLFPGEEVKIQTIIAWETDEPATCQVFYTQGLGGTGSSEDGESLPPELNPTTSHTQVIVGFGPATVYKFWMRCQDPSRNESRSEDYVLITPVKEKSIIDIILENFEGTFGWVKNISK